MAAEAVRLTQLSHGAGCGCKLRPADLASVLGHLAPSQDPRLLIGLATRDDAAVFRLSGKLALVATTDFFTPVVDDPFVFGRIAAANALSDVYAMGGKPLFALSLVGFPLATLGAEMLGRILEGAASACTEAGIEIVGGHSIDDPEPKFGLAVTGTVRPNRALSNARARPGDALVLTKPLGAGLATTAIKKGVGSPAIDAAVKWMSTLNRAAGEVFARARVNALTDVTGFGLLGHLWNVVEASRVSARVRFDDVPLMPGVQQLAEAGIVPGGSRRNLADVATHVRFPDALAEWKRLVLADAQTNGGLLATVRQRQVPSVLKSLRKRGVEAAVIGSIAKGRPEIFVE
jgi:selenide,water dikinase